MRTRTLIWLLAAITAACDGRPPSTLPTPTVGLELKPTDSLLMMGSKMFPATAEFESPSDPRLVADTAAQNALDRHAMRALGRRSWALWIPGTGDRLVMNIVNGPPVATEQHLRVFASDQRRASLVNERRIETDTVEWHDAVHEYRHVAYEPSTKSDFVMRCVSSADAPPPAARLVCYTATGPTAKQTLGRVLSGLKLPAYRGPVSVSRRF